MITRVKKDGARRKTEIKSHQGWKHQSCFRMRKRAAKKRWEGGMKGISLADPLQNPARKGGTQVQVGAERGSQEKLSRLAMSLRASG